jgi:hypothetical protein
MHTFVKLLQMAEDPKDSLTATFPQSVKVGVSRDADVTTEGWLVQELYHNN